MTEQEKLLSEVSKILEKHETSRQLTGSDFNIFSILNVERDETKICRVIKELLDPSGFHSQGDIYLKLFLEEVMDIHNVDSKNAIVRREDRTGEGNRVDITIDIKPSCFIAIEVKIDALLGNNQLERYYNDAKKRSPNPIIVYLSKFKNPPLDKNNGLGNTLKAEDVEHITWSKDIIDWLKKCADISKGIARIHETILQLIMTVENFTGQLKDGELIDIKPLITQSPENFRNAQALARAFDECATEKVRDFINSLIDKINVKTKKSFEYERDGNSISKTADNFYDTSKHNCNGYIGMTCEYTSASDTKIFVRFGISKQYGVDFGYWLAGEDYKRKTDKTFCEELKKLLPANVAFNEGDTSWLYIEKYQGDFPNLYDFYDIETLNFLSDDKRIESFTENFSDKIKNLVDGNP